MKFDPATGKTAVYRDPSGRSNVLKFDAAGRLVACEGANTGGNRRVSVTENDGSIRNVADRCDDFDTDRGNNGTTVTADGLLVAAAGRGKAAGVSVFRPDGKRIEFLPMSEDPTTCCFAGPDRRTLYVTAGNSLDRVQTGMTGVPRISK